MSQNPLLSYDGLPPFSAIRAEHIEPALDRVLADNRARIQELTAAAATPGWDSFVEVLETLDERLHRVWSPAAHLNAVMNSPDIRAAYNACLPKLSDYETELGHNVALQKGYLALKSGPDWANFNTAQRKLIEDELRDFHLAGVDLPADRKARFRDLMQQLSTLEARFEENLLDATQGWFKHLTDEPALSGIPVTALQQARQAAKSRGLDGWVFTLDYPSYSAVISYADDRTLREEFYRAYATRASDQGPQAGRWDNTGVMREILRLRHEAAQLTGFANYAEYSLASKMAKTPAEVVNFLDDLVQRCRAAGRHEFMELCEYALERDGIGSLQAWDVSYYAEKLKLDRFAIDDEMLRPYFPLPRVLQGLFDIVQKLYGITLQQVEDADVWHPDVLLYRITDSGGDVRGELYFDFYTRTGKRNGAWMDDCRNRRRFNSSLQIPVAYLTCNFPPPLEQRPSLLTHDDVVTLFHEFGHCLHHLLTKIDYPAVAGINGVAWDAVELPSQFHENFAWTREGLAAVSGHFETGQTLPDDLFRKLTGARHFHTALFMLRQLEFALFDFSLHMGASLEIGDDYVSRILSSVRKNVSVIPVPDWNRFAHSFSHIFAGGYAAGYYSYLWAEVLAADAYAAFEEHGVFDRNTGQRFMDTILGQGGSRDAMDLFVEFRGRKPELDAFLRLNGIAA
ncbi:MAG TPA: M3 family metallopeptidase [Gammaproteobacteria bacterium]|nr:M3 family metallopeptidase [Gammaproteobacteria bacterium]